MALMKIKVATWEYLDSEGRRRRAYFDDTVDLTEAEVERAEKAGVFAAGRVAPEAAEEADGGADEAAVDSMPLQAAPKAAWVEYAVSRGVERAEAEALSKADLRARLMG